MQTAGTLWFSVPCYTLVWFLSSEKIPTGVSLKATLAIGYLGIFGSVIGFIIYYFLIQKLPSHKVALVSLMTPVFAMMLGHMVNQEQWHHLELIGAALILGALAMHQVDNHIGILHANRIQR
jgi:drug/metabolite transporter (DMT)-like permease